MHNGRVAPDGNPGKIRLGRSGVRETAIAGLGAVDHLEVMAVQVERVAAHVAVVHHQLHGLVLGEDEGVGGLVVGRGIGGESPSFEGVV